MEAELEVAAGERAARSRYWDTAKGVLILLVVAGHLMGPDTIPAGLPVVLSEVYDVIFCFHMPAFVLVSGYFWGRSSRDPVERIPRFACIYLLMSVLYGAVVPLVFGEPLNMRLGSPRYGLWYLVFLVYASVLAHFVKGATEKGRRHAIIASVVASLLVGLDQTVGDAWDAARAFYFMPFLIAGMVLDVDSLIERARSHRGLCVAAFLVTPLVLHAMAAAGLFRGEMLYGRSCYAEMGQPWYVGIPARALMYVISCVLTVAFFGLVPVGGEAHLAVLGHESLVIYLTHTFMLRELYDRWCNVVPLGLVGDLATFVALIALVCAALIWSRHVWRGRRGEAGGSSAGSRLAH